jgi:hypothetical protein
MAEKEYGKYVEFDDLLSEIQDVREEFIKFSNTLINRNLALKAEIKSLKQYKADIDEAHKQVMSESCPPDEKHCTCVPILRAEIARLREVNRGLVDALLHVSDQFSYCLPYKMTFMIDAALAKAKEVANV